MIPRFTFIGIYTAVAYIAMIAVNALANILPINNLTTGAVSDAYPNLFAPAGITFSIWGLIYLLLGMYTVYQFIGMRNVKKQKFISRVNWYFILTSLINAAWIFSWHYQIIWISVILMLALLISLVRVNDFIANTNLSLKEKLLVKVPFGVYFGWITIATIANITTFLVSIAWDGFGIADSTWMIAVLLVGVGISVWRMIKDNNIAYGLVPVWAYIGIWLKHTSPAGFDGQYSLVISTVLFSMAILLVANGYLIVKKHYL